MRRNVELSHTITLNGSVDQVFPLFTPLGETAWVPDWKPNFLHPPDGETCTGMVFQTDHGGEETLWACVDWRPDERRVRYVRVTPQSRFGFVEVTCQEEPGGYTKALVSYAFTALTAAGEMYLAEMSEPRFAAMIDEWRGLINEHLVSRARTA